MLHDINIEHLEFILNTYINRGFIRWAINWAFPSPNPGPIALLVSLVNVAKANDQKGPINEEQQTIVAHAYAQLCNSNDAKLDFLSHSLADMIGDAPSVIIRSLYSANILDKTSLKIISESIVVDDKSQVPMPSELTYQLIASEIHDFATRKTLTYANLRWLILVGGYYLENEEKYEATFRDYALRLLTVAPLTYELATIIGRSPDPISATILYIANADLLKNFPKEALAGPKPLEAAIALAHFKSSRFYNKNNEDIILESFNPESALKALWMVKEGEMDISLLKRLKHPHILVRDLKYLKQANLDEDIIKLRCDAALELQDEEGYEKFPDTIELLYEKSILSKDTFSLVHKFDYDSIVTDALCRLGRKDISKDILEKLLAKKNKWFLSFNNALIEFKNNNMPLTDEVLKILVDTKMPRTKAVSALKFMANGSWDDAKDVIAQSSAEHKETTAFVKAFTALRAANLDHPSFFRDMSFAINTARIRREENPAKSDSEEEYSPKVARLS